MAKSKPRYGIHIALLLVSLTLACPALYALQVATLTLEESFVTPPKLFPPGGDLPDNAGTLIDDKSFDKLIVNTFTVALVVVLVKTLFAMLAGLAFVYFEFPGKWVLFFFILFTLLMPTELILVPLSDLVADLKWVGQGYGQLALTMPFLASAVGTFLFRQHFTNIPRELVEAAQLDGASPLRFMAAVLLPMSWNVIGAHAVIQFISMWNQYAWPIFLNLRPAETVIQVGVRTAVAGDNIDFGLLMTAGVIASIPPLLFFIALQRQFMSGFALTRDK